MKNIFWILPVIMFSVFACSGDISTDIIGEWECSRLKQTLHFYSDQGVELIDKKVGYGKYIGTYSIQGKMIIFKFPRFSRPVERKIKKLNNDKLILLDQNGIEEVYLRK